MLNLIYIQLLWQFTTPITTSCTPSPNWLHPLALLIPMNCTSPDLVSTFSISRTQLEVQSLKPAAAILMTGEAKANFLDKIVDSDFIHQCHHWIY